MIFPLPFPRAPTVPTSDYFRQPFWRLGLGLRRERFPSVFLRPSLYIGARPSRGILRGPPVPPLFTLMVNLSTPPSTSIGSATGFRQNTLLLPTFLAGSPSRRPPSPPLSAFLLRAPAWPPTLLTASLTLSSFLYYCMALTSSSTLRECSRKWTFIGARSRDGRRIVSGPRPPPYWPLRPAFPLSLF